MRHLANYSPGQHIEQIRHEGLVEIPQWAGGEEDGGELGGNGVENVAPVAMYIKTKWTEYDRGVERSDSPIDCLPHVSCDLCYSRRAAEVFGERLAAEKSEEDAEGNSIIKAIVTDLRAGRVMSEITIRLCRWRQLKYILRIVAEFALAR